MYFQLELINNAKLGKRQWEAHGAIVEICDHWGENFDWINDENEEGNRQLAINSCLTGISDFSDCSADLTYQIIAKEVYPDVTITLTEDERSLIWYVLKSLSNERDGCEDEDMLMEHVKTSDINKVLESFIVKTK